jgi:integrase
VKHIRDCLRNALNVAANEWNLIPSNPVPKVRLPRIPKREMKFFSLNEAHAFMAATRNHKLEALFQIALMLGMRQGELLSLRWADIDLENGILQVRSSLLFSGGKFHIAKPKSTKGHRIIPLPEFTRQVLLRHQIEQDRLRMEAGSEWVEWGLVSPTKIGTPRHRRNLLRLYYTLIKSADLPQIRFHDLRHSAAAILISLGASPKYVQQILGHADFATTMNLYGHLFNEVKTEMAAKVDTSFGTPEARSPRSTRQTN